MLVGQVRGYTLTKLSDTHDGHHESYFGMVGQLTQRALFKVTQLISRTEPGSQVFCRINPSQFSSVHVTLLPSTFSYEVFKCKCRVSNAKPALCWQLPTKFEKVNKGRKNSRSYENLVEAKTFNKMTWNTFVPDLSQFQAQIFLFWNLFYKTNL